jgi:uncharacterized FlaG/YvyC family protein
VNTIRPVTPKPATIAAAPVQPSLTKPLQITEQARVEAKKVDPVGDAQANKEVRALRMNQALDQSQLDYAYDKKSGTLSVAVTDKQTGQFVRQINYPGFQAMAYESHGYKGRWVDHDA